MNGQPIVPNGLKKQEDVKKIVIQQKTPKPIIIQTILDKGFFGSSSLIMMPGNFAKLRSLSI
jgi:hypothetical protein